MRIFTKDPSAVTSAQTLVSVSQTSARLCRPGTSSLSEKLSHRPPVLGSLASAEVELSDSVYGAVFCGQCGLSLVPEAL